MTPTVLTKMRRVLPGLVAGCCAVAAFVIGVRWGGFFGGGPDESGYVSQAERWITGQLVTPIPEWARVGRWENAVESGVPVGYAADLSKTKMVPVYAPGLPLMMSLFQRVGGRDAVFYVVPLFGTMVVWVTFALGRQMAGSWAGVAGAVLLLASPPFLWMLLRPMSDVPAAACWSAAVLWAWRPRVRDAVLAGVLAGLAILVRPNTVLLLAIPLLLVWSRREARVRRALWLAISAAPAGLFIAFLNARWYGSPLKSGYGSLAMLYSTDRIIANIRLYGGWFLATQTPLAVMWLSAPVVVRGDAVERYRLALVAVAYPLAVFAVYAAYLSFDEWAYLRFLLPAFPAIYASFAAVCVEFAAQVHPRRLALPAVIAVVASLGIQEWRFAADAGTFRYDVGEQRFERAVELANALPPKAILLSNAYSGTLRFYSGRDVLHLETVLPHELDRALVYLRDGGHMIYFVGDPFEEAQFKSYFADTDAAREFDMRRLPDVGYGFVAADLTPDTPPQLR